MCGIAGILNLCEAAPVSEDLLRRMVGILQHRGPDESGIYLDRRVGLGHARLSIIGVENGTQPLSNEDGSLWIVYNGEAFNYIELRRELADRGHIFSTGADTEVVLHLYEEYGAVGLEKINGQFAFAIWDARRRELFIARDRLGVRPLYYVLAGNRLLFASEIKALLLHPDIHRAIDLETLAQVFTFWAPLSPRTPFEGVRELPPGHYAVIREGSIDLRRWWEIPWSPSGGEWGPQSFEQAREELIHLMGDAVKLRLRADVPVGAYLSGGLDSSILSSLAAEARGGDLKTYSLGFTEKAFDETSFQEEMVRRLGTEHHRLQVTATDILENLSETVWHCEKPLLRTAPTPLFLLSRRVRESGLKVVLTGEGADEVFGGYNLFKEAKVRRFWSRIPDSRRRPLLLERLYPYIFRNPARTRHYLRRFYAPNPEEMNDPCFSHRIRWRNGMRFGRFLSQESAAAIDWTRPFTELALQLPPGFSDRDDLSRAQWLEMSVFLSGYLLSSQGDRVAMGHSVEVRHPFLDYRMIDFAARLPARWKIRGLNEKYILKKSFGDRLPESIHRRAKQPYRAPIGEIFASGGKESLIDFLLTGESLRRSRLFDPTRVEALLQRFRKAPSERQNESMNMIITGIATTQLLHYQFVQGARLQDIPSAEPNRVVRRQDRPDFRPKRWPAANGRDYQPL